jgi:hypothetical protein
VSFALAIDDERLRNKNSGAIDPYSISLRPSDLPFPIQYSCGSGYSGVFKLQMMRVRKLVCLICESYVAHAANGYTQSAELRGIDTGDKFSKYSQTRTTLGRERRVDGETAVQFVVLQ